jgi:hypothetical protein
MEEAQSLKCQAQGDNDMQALMLVKKCIECADACEEDGMDECAKICRECAKVCELCVWPMRITHLYVKENVKNMHGMCRCL